MENLKELSIREMQDINGGAILPLMISMFKNTAKVVYDAATLGWRFGKYLAGE